MVSMEPVVVPPSAAQTQVVTDPSRLTRGGAVFTDEFWSRLTGWKSSAGGGFWSLARYLGDKLVTAVVVVALAAAVMAGPGAGGCVPWSQPNPPGPQPPPGPGPNPPTPGPVKDPHVLMLYESADVSKYPPAQQAVLTGKAVRDYLDAHTPAGPDGKTHEWRVWDKDVDATHEEQVWKDLLARPHPAVPCVIVSNGAGKVAYEGPLPGNPDEAIALLKKYGG